MLKHKFLLHLNVCIYQIWKFLLLTNVFCFSVIFNYNLNTQCLHKNRNKKNLSSKKVQGNFCQMLKSDRKVLNLESLILV